MTAKEAARQRAQDHNANTFLLKLPAEIRNQIYDLCVERKKYPMCPIPKSKVPDEYPWLTIWLLRPMVPGLAQVCAQIRSEFQPLCWKDTHIALMNHSLGKFLQDFSERNTRHAHRIFDWVARDAQLSKLRHGSVSVRGVVPEFCYGKVSLSNPSQILEPVVPGPNFQLVEPGNWPPIFTSEDRARLLQVDLSGKTSLKTSQPWSSSSSLSDTINASTSGLPIAKYEKST